MINLGDEFSRLETMDEALSPIDEDGFEDIEKQAEHEESFSAYERGCLAA